LKGKEEEEDQKRWLDTIENMRAVSVCVGDVEK